MNGFEIVLVKKSPCVVLAYFKKYPKAWGHGRTATEAIGSLVFTYGESFGINFRWEAASHEF